MNPESRMLMIHVPHLIISQLHAEEGARSQQCLGVDADNNEICSFPVSEFDLGTC